MDNAEDSFHASPDVICKLQLIMSNVEENDGKMIPGEMWCNEDAESELVVSSTGDRETTISLAKSILKREEDLLEVISFLASSLTKRISRFRSCMPIRGPTDLPDELVAHIFDLTEPNLNNLLHILQVCKSFRRIALSSPRLWARQWLSLELSSYTINAIVKRSGVLGLHAEFRSLPEAGHVMFRCPERWTTLHLHDFAEDEVKSFQSFVPCEKLSGLKSMVLDVEPSGNNIWQLSSAWSLPSLKTLECLSATSMPRLLQTSALTKCHLDFHNSIPVSKLASFLSACPSLETLSISLNAIRYDDTDISIKTSLPALKHFTLISHDVHPLAFNRLVLSLMFPKLEFVRAVWTGPYFRDTAVVGCFCALLRATRTVFPELKEAEFTVRSGGRDSADIAIPTVLELLPDSIQSLLLTLGDIHLHGYDPDIRVVPCKKLQLMRFLHCNQLDSMIFDELATLFEESGIEYVKLEVDDCTTLGYGDQECTDDEGDGDQENIDDEGSGDKEYTDDEDEKRILSGRGLINFRGGFVEGRMHIDKSVY